MARMDTYLSDEAALEAGVDDCAKVVVHEIDQQEQLYLILFNSDACTVTYHTVHKHRIGYR